MMCVPQLVENTHAGLNFHFYVFTIGLGQMEESAKFISKKGKDRFHPKRCTRGLFCRLCPCDLWGGGDENIPFAPIKLEAILLKELLV